MSKTKSEKWYEILLEEFYKEGSLDQLNKIRENAIARCNSEKQLRNVRKNYHMNMQNGRLKQKLEDYEGKSLASRLDLFFGVNKKPTNELNE